MIHVDDRRLGTLRGGSCAVREIKTHGARSAPWLPGSSADDSNGLTALDVDDDHKMLLSRTTNQDEPFISSSTE